MKTRKKGQKVTEKQERTKRLGKAAVVLTAFVSLLAIGVSPAAADDHERSYDMTVTVTDTSIPACAEDYTIATWNPDPTAFFPSGEIDLATPAAVTFSVGLGFQNGIDQGNCDPAGPNVAPTGTVTAEFSVLANELVSTVNCNPPGFCNPSDIMGDALGGTIEGTLALKEDFTPGTYLATEGGSYLATLRVVWTLPPS